MWISSSTYERLPLLWSLLGVSFVLNGLYLGLDIPASRIYMAIGLLCCVFGIGTAVVRVRARRDRSENDDSVVTPE